jgi:RHS repeat-associated protein
VANPQGTAGCGTAVPHAHNGYDEGMSGLAATYWTNGRLAGPAASHATGTGGSPGSSFCAATSGVCAQWPAGSPPMSSDASGHWGLRLTGTINVPVNSGLDFGITTTQPTTVSIDGNPVLDVAQAPNVNWTPGQVIHTTYSDTIGNGDGLGLAPGLHSIEVNFDGSATQLNELDLSWASTYLPPNGQAIPSEDIPLSAVDPGYSLKTSTTDPDGKVTTTSYSNSAIDPAFGLPTATTTGAGTSAPLTTTTTYEAPGAGSFLRRSATILPAGNQTSYSYYTGTGGPVAAACGVTASTPQGGELEQQTNPAPGGSGQARVQQFIYDAAGRPAGVRVGTAGDISTASFQCTTYDARGRTASESWPAVNGSPARTVTYAYAVGGNPLVSSVADVSGTITATVDLLGRPVSYTDGWNQTTTYSFNQAGQSTASSGPGGSLQYGYDPNSGQPTTTTVNGTVLATAGYDPATGRMTSVRYGNGTTATLGYDPSSRPDSLAYTNTSSGSTLATDSVTYSPAGRKTTETTSQPGSSALLAISYGYDGAGRLTSATDTAGGVNSAFYSYASNPASDNCPSALAGKNTNRTRVTVSGSTSTTTDYCYNGADQLVSAISGGTTSTGYSYNEHGDQTSDNGTTYTWDAADRVATATKGGTTVTSTYDAVDRLIQAASSPGSTVRYAYAGYTDAAAAVLDASSNVLQRIVPLPGGVTVVFQPSGNTWSYSNLQGDTTITASSTGGIISGPVTYDPWGSLNPGGTAPANATGPNALGAYSSDGKLTSTVTGTILLGARTFNPAEARFLSVDPVNGGCANPYTYSFGDPLNHADLSGRNACTDYFNFTFTDFVKGLAFFVAGEIAADLLAEAGSLLAALVPVVENAVEGALDELTSPADAGAPSLGHGGPLTENDKELLAKAYAADDLKVNTNPNSYYEIGYHQWLYDCWSAGIWMNAWGPPPKAP